MRKRRSSSLCGLILAAMLCALPMTAQAADYEFVTDGTPEYYGSTSYEDVYGSQYNYGGPNIVDYRRDRNKRVPPAVSHLVFYIPFLISRSRVAEIRLKPVMQHKPAESICQHTLGPLQYLSHRRGQVVKLQAGRYSAYVFKDPLQPCQ